VRLRVRKGAITAHAIFDEGMMMTKATLGLAAATLLGLAAFSVPASAFQAASAPAVASNVTKARLHGPVCVVRTVVSRGPHGHKIVRKVRTCR
jgi:hypothetical protein